MPGAKGLIGLREVLGIWVFRVWGLGFRALGVYRHI